MRRARRALSWMLTPCLLAAVTTTPVPAQQAGGSPLTPLPYPDLPPPEFPEAGMSLWMIFAGSIVLVAMVAVVVLLLRFRPAAVPPPPLHPLRRAMDRLASLAARLENLPPAEIGHEVSLILREYQQERYGVPAPFLTSEELYGGGPGAAREELRVRFGPVAAMHDRLAFAPAPATQADGEALIGHALQALHEERVHSAPPTLPPPQPAVPARA